jgi:hypothetical protein
LTYSPIAGLVVGTGVGELQGTSLGSAETVGVFARVGLGLGGLVGIGEVASCTGDGEHADAVPQIVRTMRIEEGGWVFIKLAYHFGRLTASS